jgi:hypothetical protein
VPTGGYDLISVLLDISGAANSPLVSFGDANAFGRFVYAPSAPGLFRVLIIFGTPFFAQTVPVTIDSEAPVLIGYPIVPMVVNIYMPAVALSILAISICGYYNEVLPNTH